jgi:hypothetical protein
LNYKQVQQVERRFLRGDDKANVPVWNLLMFQMWCNRWL